VGGESHFAELEAEHEQLARRTRDLAAAVHLLAEAEPATPPWLIQWAIAVFDAHRLHAQAEERLLFPVVLDAFGSRDWDLIAREEHLSGARGAGTSGPGPGAGAAMKR